MSSKRDWSSDVCSSDLSTLITNGFSGLIGMGISSVVSLAVRHFKIISKLLILIGFLGVVIIYSKTEKISSTLIQGLWITQENERSEERRVGKECRTQQR